MALLSRPGEPYGAASDAGVLLLGASFALVPANMKKDPAWLQPFRRSLLELDVWRLFPSLKRSEGAREAAVHQALISDVIRAALSR